MNWEWYSLINKLLHVLAEPLWKILNTNQTPIIAAALLGLLGILTVSQLTVNFLIITYATNRMIQTPKWFIDIIALFVGKIVGVYLVTFSFLYVDTGWISPFLNVVNRISGIILVIIGVFLLLDLRIKKLKVYRYMRNYSYLGFLTGILLGISLSLIMGPGLLLISKLMLTWVSNTAGYGIILPIIFSFVSFSPAFLYGALAYGFELDILFRKKAMHVQLIMMILLMLLGFNQIIMYWL